MVPKFDHRVDRDTEGLHRYAEEYEETINRQRTDFNNQIQRGIRRDGREVSYVNVENRRALREHIENISQRVVQNPINILRQHNRLQNQQVTFNRNFNEVRLHRGLRRNRRFNESNSSYEINIRNLPNNHNVLHDILFLSIHDLITVSFGNDPATPSRRVRLAIYHDDFEKLFGFPYMRRQDMTTELVMAKFL